jgi:tRNA A-37 threonylcarbamoyl transferase component Bud32
VDEQGEQLSLNSAGLTMNEPIGRGTDAIVELTPDGRRVLKRLLITDEVERRNRAQREFEALQIAERVLKPFPGVRTPRPECVTTSGEIVMEYCDGVQLDEALATVDPLDSVHATRISEQLGDAIAALSEALPIDQLDFSVRNTLVQSHPTRIVLLDFTPRPLSSALPKDVTGVEVALASFLTSAITYQIRRSTLRNMAGARSLRRLASIIAWRASNQTFMRHSHITRVAWLFFWRQSRNRGWLRFAWFHTIGAIMFSMLLRRTLAESRAVTVRQFG